MGTRRGRPLSFDRETALDRATHVFWDRGYEAASVSDLTSAMGITPPSLYTAFGSKRELFVEVVDRYQRTYGAAVSSALEEAATARDGIAAMLAAAAVDYTEPGHPPGCLIITAATNCGPESADVQEELRRRRARRVASFADRIAAGAAAGELPPGTDPHALASFYAAVLQGMSQRARDGATRADLRAVADLAMAAWPSSG